MLRRVPWLLCLLLTVILWLGWVFTNKPVPVVALHLYPQPAIKWLTVSGEVQATPIATVSPQTTARLTDIRVQPGDRIAVGQVVARLETTESWALQRQVKAEWQVAKQEVKEALSGHGTVLLMLHDGLNKARSKLDTAQQSFQQAQQLLQSEELKSPAAGIVARRLQEPGDMSSPGQPILTLISPNQINVQVDLPKEALNQVYKGQPAQIRLIAESQSVIKAHVIDIQPLNAERDRYPVLLRLDPSALRILPGMQATVDLETERFPQAIVLPAQAIDNQIPSVEGEVRVYKIDQHRIHSQRVKVIALSADQVQVLSGLKPGDWVVEDANRPIPVDKNVTPVERVSE